MRKFLFVLLACLPLMGCETLKGMVNTDTALGAVKGASAVAEAEDIHERLIAYFDGDAQAINDIAGPAVFFNRGLRVIQGDLQRPVVEVFEEYPEYVADIGDQWSAGKQVIDDYAARSGKPVPTVIVAWMGNAEAGWETVKQAVKLHDYAVVARDIYRLAKPFALMLL